MKDGRSIALCYNGDYQVQHHEPYFAFFYVDYRNTSTYSTVVVS
jgi:hypothetical protein